MRDEIEAFGRKWKRVWVEDEATRNFPNNAGHEYVDAAWKRLFGGEYPKPAQRDAHEDWGDATAVRIGDRMVVSSFDGDSIYVPADAPRCTCDAIGEGPCPVHPCVCPARPCPACAPAVTHTEPLLDPYTAMVREFHERMGLVVRDAPSLGTPAEREERVRLMQEELLEMARALCVEIRWADEHRVWNVSDFTIRADGTEPDAANALHELADLQATVSGTAVQFGLPLLAATREVHAANMRKTPRGPGRKPLKPEGWKPADVSRVLAENVTHAADPLPLAALQDAPCAVLRQLAGADPSQPTSAVLAGPATRACDPEMHKVNGFCVNCSDGWL